MAQMYVDGNGNRYFNNPTRNNARDDREQYDVANPYYNAMLNGGVSTQANGNNYTATNAITNNWSSQRILGGNGGNPGNGYSPNYYSMLANYYKKQNDEAQKAALAAIEERLKTNVDMYNQQLPQVNNAYQNLIDQNEVNRYRNRASIREALANRGQLDTGLGRQEMLNANATNSRNLNNILLEREGARNDIQNAISQLKADAESDKANVKATYTQALKDWVSKQK